MVPPGKTWKGVAAASTLESCMGERGLSMLSGVSLVLRALNPLASTIIVIAVTITLVFAFLGYVRFLAEPRASSLLILPDSYYDPGSGVLCLHLRNTGDRDVSPYRVEVLGVGMFSLDTVISAGSDETVCVTAAPARVSASHVRVKLYTRDGLVYPCLVRVEYSAAASSSSGGNVVYVASTVSLDTPRGTWSWRLTGSLEFTNAASSPGEIELSGGGTVEVPPGARLKIVVDAVDQGEISFTVDGRFLVDEGLPVQAIYVDGVLAAENTVIKEVNGVRYELSTFQSDLVLTVTGSGRVKLYVDGNPVLVEDNYSGTIRVYGVKPSSTQGLYLGLDDTDLEGSAERVEYS